MVFLPNLGVNRRDRLCGIPEYASAQSLDLLDLGQKSSFLNWKRRQVSIFKKIINGWALDGSHQGVTLSIFVKNRSSDKTASLAPVI